MGDSMNDTFKGDALVVQIPIADLAQLGERQTEDLKVPGSIPGVGTSFCFFLDKRYYNIIHFFN